MKRLLLILVLTLGGCATVKPVATQTETAVLDCGRADIQKQVGSALTALSDLLKKEAIPDEIKAELSQYGTDVAECAWKKLTGRE